VAGIGCVRREVPTNADVITCKALAPYALIELVLPGGSTSYYIHYRCCLGGIRHV